MGTVVFLAGLTIFVILVDVFATAFLFPKSPGGDPWDSEGVTPAAMSPGTVERPLSARDPVGSGR